jgi:hypothetical protein
MTTHSRTLSMVFSLLMLAASSGCRDTPLAVNVDANNKAPEADAGEDQMFPFTGSPVTVTLDGSMSVDEDGAIVTYRWLSADTADGGPGRADIDPDDVVSPMLTLGEGTWNFMLVAIDDDGVVSVPDNVTIKIGTGLSRDEELCIMDATPSIDPVCTTCVCTTDAMCRELLVACDAPCWTFYTCVENNCVQFTTPEPGDDDALADCARANCSDYFGGVGFWIPLEACVRQDACAKTCSDSVLGDPF